MKTLKLSPDERILCTKTPPRISRFASAIPGEIPGAERLTSARLITNSVPSSRWPCSQRILVGRNASSACAPRMTTAPLIYAVDDVPELTGLYTMLLEPLGYVVKPFNDRAEALAALEAERMKPELLVTDCLGVSMPVDQFVKRCLVVHPSLRILMASGLNQTDGRFSYVRPDRFLQKPFTAEEFLREVRAALISR
jgi:CheY-like chemotaxis protein